MTTNLFHNFDFLVLNSSEFKEDSVREEIIQPILSELGYSASGDAEIIRSKPLLHPFTKIGSTKHKVIIPDYLLQVDGKNAWVLDAKAPSEVIDTGDNVQQVYSYATHIDIRVALFALCNGKEFILFDNYTLEPILHFQMHKFVDFWHKLNWLLSPQAFRQKSKERTLLSQSDEKSSSEDIDYIVEKEIGVLWSHRADISEYSEIVRFRGQLLAEARTEDINGPKWYELYRLQNGRYVVFITYNHRFDYGGAKLRGVNAWDEFDPPLTQRQVQDEYPMLAKEAGLVRVREFNPNE